MQEDLTMTTCNIQALLDLTKEKQGSGTVNCTKYSRSHLVNIKRTI